MKRERERDRNRERQSLTCIHALRLEADFGCALVVAGKPILSRKRGAPCDARGWEQIILEQFTLQNKRYINIKYIGYIIYSM